ncbi:MAG TPA: hypothetical protein VFA20_32250, partial [Myxococcaceae bacterium]|nr:hypothetical protein [Myxococcaceae bacterium]
AIAAEQRAHQAKISSEIEKARLEAHAHAEREAAVARARLEAVASAAQLEQAQIQAQAERARLEAEVASAQAEVAHAQAQVVEAHHARVTAEVRIAELEQRRAWLGHETELARARSMKEIENTVSPEMIQLQVAHQLPAIAAAFQQKMGEVHVTAVDGANPFGYIAAAVEGVMGIARSAGLKPNPTNGHKPVPAAE